MSYANLRKGRCSQCNRAYFITTVTHHRRNIFNNLHCARLLVAVMKVLQDAGRVESLSWVIMPDHLHWLFRLAEGNDLSQVVKYLKAVSAREINDHLRCRGSVWQKAFHEHGVRDGEDLQVLSRYIVANPVRAKLVQSVADYPHWDAVWL